MSIKVLVVYDVILWAYHRRSQALAKYSPDDIEITTASFVESEEIDDLGKFDVVFAIDYQTIRHWRNRVNRVLVTRRPVLISSFNKDRNSRQHQFRVTLKNSDFVICNNRDIWLYAREQGFSRANKTCCISNGVDMDVFKVTTPIEDRPRRVLWTGSTGPAKMKRWQEIIQPLRPRLDKLGIEHDFRPIDHVPAPNVYTTEEMVEWYNGGSVILCASATEGSPNLLQEGASCKCVPVMTHVANVQEMGKHKENMYVAQPTIDDFVTGIEYALENRVRLSDMIHCDLVNGGWDWRIRSQYFYGLFRQAALGGRESLIPFSYEDVGPDEIGPYSVAKS